MRVLYSGYFDRGNLGDNAMRSGTLAHLSVLHPQWDIVQVPLPPVRLKGIREFIAFGKAIYESDVLIVNGGTYLHDRFGVRSLRIFVSFLVMTTMARVLRSRVVFAGIGLGRIERKWAQMLGWLIFKSSDYVLLRDGGSRDILEKIYPRVPHEVGADAAFLLPVASIERPLQQGQARVGVSLAPYFAAYAGDDHGDAATVDALAKALGDLHRDGRFACVEVHVFSEARWRDDVALSCMLRDRLQDIGVPCDILRGREPELFLAAIARCDVYFAVRYHAMLLAHLVGVPTIAFPYEEKSLFLADELDVPPASIVTSEDLRSVEALRDVFERALDHPELFRSDPVAREVLIERAASGLDLMVRHLEEKM